jgi:solute carrier family 25 (mitochondrial carnitine/acylcarnitine transporter), member 20/29
LQYNGHGIRGLYKGFYATALFRSFFFCWWGSYDIISDLLKEKTNLSLPAVNFWAGGMHTPQQLRSSRSEAYATTGLSAQIFWITSYPSDVVKQRIMTDPLGPERRFPRWKDAAVTVWRENGWRGFWRGFVPCFLRAFPANAVALVLFEGVMRSLP